MNLYKLHYFEFLYSTHGDLVAQCIHYTGKIILESSTKEDGIASQISSRQDAVAHYAVGRSLGIKMQMAGITNCSFPYLPRYFLITSDFIDHILHSNILVCRLILKKRRQNM